MPTTAHFPHLAGRPLLGRVHLDDDWRITAADSTFHETFVRDTDPLAGTPFARFLHGPCRGEAGRDPGTSAQLTMVDRHGERVAVLVAWASLTAAVHLHCTECSTSAVIVRATGAPAHQLSAPALSEVTARILEGLACGLSTQQLASRLCLSNRGIEYHISNMLRSFNAANRSALVARAYALGIISPLYWPPRVRRTEPAHARTA